MKILLSNSKINYKASIYFDRNKIKSDLAADKRLTENDYGKINKVLDEVDSFSRMPQTSVVETISRNDNNMINLISYVSDEKSTITRMISERSVRKMVADDEFASRYTEKIKQAIIDMPVEKEGLDKIKETIKNSKTFVGWRSESNPKETVDLSKEKLAERFCEKLKYSFDREFQNGNNPTNRVVSILEKLDKAEPELEKYIGLTRFNKGEYMFGVIAKKDNKIISIKEIKLSNLFKDPADKLF